MRRVLVTGASGFLGSRVAELFRGSWEVLAPSRRELDVADREMVLACLREWRPEAAVHCAAVSDIGRCEQEPERSWNVNVEGSVNLAMAAGLVGAKCLLCSSDQVYSGIDGDAPRREDEALEPGNLYGREKLCAEERCREANPDCVLLRLSWMYDVRTLHPGERSDFLRTLLAQLGTAERLVYPVHDTRGITDVWEVAGNLEAAFSLVGGVYNFGAPNGKNMYETVRSLFAGMGWDAGRLEPDGARYALQPRNLAMSQEKLNASGIFFTDTEERLLHRLRTIEDR